MQGKKQDNFRKLSFRSKRRLVQTIRSVANMDNNSDDMVEGLLAIFNFMNEVYRRNQEDSNQYPAASAKSKSEEFRSQWLDKQEVMQLIPISSRGLFNLRKSGKLPSYSFQGKFFFKLSDIEKLMKKKGD